MEPDVEIKVRDRGPYKVSGPVRLVVHAPDAKRVEVTGDFTDWQSLALRPAGGGLWEVVLPITSGEGLYFFRLGLCRGRGAGAASSSRYCRICSALRPASRSSKGKPATPELETSAYGRPLVRGS